MIEQALLFTLGVLTASLLLLLFLPVVSRRATRLATRRVQMQLPLSMGEIAAGRDQIRAEHAVAVRRLEQAIEREARDKAEAMGEVGRLATRLVDLEERLEAALAQNQGLRGEFDAAVRDMRDAQATLGLQMQLLHDSHGLADRRLAILRTTQAQLAASESLVDGHRGTIAGMETRSIGQDLRIRSLMAQGASLAEDVAQTRTRLGTTTVERDGARADAAALAAKRDALQSELAEEREKVARGETRLATQSETLAATAAQRAQQEAEIAGLRQRLTDLQARSDGEPDGSPGDEIDALRRAISNVAADIVRWTQAAPPVSRLAEPDGSSTTSPSHPAAPV